MFFKRLKRGQSVEIPVNGVMVTVTVLNHTRTAVELGIERDGEHEVVTLDVAGDDEEGKTE